MPHAEIIRSGDGWEVWEQGELHYKKSGDMPDCTANSRPWGSKFFSAIIEPGVTRIGNYAFYYNRELVYVEIPQSVREIGNYAFYGCDSLERVTIPEGVESIGERAFDQCNYLTEIVLPASLTRIGRNAFSLVGFFAVGREEQLIDVYYAGTQEQWNAITKVGSNSSLDDATIHYNSSGFSGAIPKLPIAQINKPLGSVVKHLNTVIRELNPVLEDIDNKQDKETGKGLSTNDYTDADKAKVAGITAPLVFESTSDFSLSGYDNPFTIIDADFNAQTGDVIGVEIQIPLSVYGNLIQTSVLDNNFARLGSWTLSIGTPVIIVTLLYDNTTTFTVGELTLEGGSNIIRLYHRFAVSSAGNHNIKLQIRSLRGHVVVESSSAALFMSLSGAKAVTA